jgi:catechol 2,3-dioxygenase-like lactoylglutathione lyase family enzyme
MGVMQTGVMQMGVVAAAPLEIGLCVSDMAASLAFYRDALGFNLVSDIEQPADKARASGLASGAYRVIRLQAPFGERVKLFLPRAADAALPRARAPLDRHGFAFLTVIVADIRATLAALARHAGVKDGPEPVELRPGTWVSLIDDPDGVPVELVSYDDLAAYRGDLKSRPEFTSQ